jgi:hypothetical protein
MEALKQHIARHGEKASHWFEPLTLFSRDFSVLFIKKLKTGFDKDMPGIMAIKDLTFPRGIKLKRMVSTPISKTWLLLQCR